MMRGAKASAITESLYQRWTEILSKLSDEFAEKIGRPKPLLKSPRSFGQKRRYRSLWHFFQNSTGSGRSFCAGAAQQRVRKRNG